MRCVDGYGGRRRAAHDDAALQDASPSRRCRAITPLPSTLGVGRYMIASQSNVGAIVVTMVDVVLVYLAIYYVLKLIRGTRAASVMLGLGIVLMIYFISLETSVGLPTVNWLLDKFIASIIIVIVVLFQQDIRRGFSKVLDTYLHNPMSSSQEANLAEELVRACVTLSQSSIGALIAIERTADLSQIAEDGIHLDAVITRELLYAIFDPGNANPLHDGAVIVKGDRVVAAGCFLPLTSNPRVDKELGTRHRAAIGLSEDTDAVILVVSEETGKISIATEGNLQRGFDANSLRDTLQTELGFKTGDETHRNRFMRRIRRSRGASKA